jgi:Holliday junction resolvase RusA-like endonuclease
MLLQSDIDNRIKILLDALQDNKIIKDDKYILELQVEKKIVTKVIN